MRRPGLTDARDALGQQKREQALHVGAILTLEDDGNRGCWSPSVGPAIELLTPGGNWTQ